MTMQSNALATPKKWDKLAQQEPLSDWEMLDLHTQQLLKEKGFGPDDMGCATCRDAGRLYNERPPHTSYCTCPLGQVYRFLDSGCKDWDWKPPVRKPPGFELFTRHEKYSMDSWEKGGKFYTDHKMGAIAAVQQFIELGAIHTGEILKSLKADIPDWLEGYDTQLNNYLPGIYLFGDVGRGKSTMLGILMRHLVESHKMVRAIEWAGFVAHIQATYTNGDRSREDILRPYIAADYLMIDDLGDPKRSEASSDRREILWLLLSPRYNVNRNGLIVTTNMDPKRFRRYFGDRIADRIFEQSAILQMGGRKLSSRTFGHEKA